MKFAIRNILAVVLFLTLLGCDQVVIIIDDVPSNTPENADLFLVSNLNYWDPGDRNFQFKKNDVKGYYYYTLPQGYGNVELMFTRGDWTTVEADICGNGVENRLFRYGVDTLRFSIESWTDLGPTNCPTVTFVLDNNSEDSVNDDIYITGNFNEWYPALDEYKLSKQDSLYYYTLKTDTILEKIEFKFTKGGWDKAEVDNKGNETPIRELRFGYVDTVEISIPNWSDQVAKNSETISFIITDIPSNTPAGSVIHIVGNFNNWYPRDRNFALARLADGSYFISLPLKEGLLEYKFTRGSWESIEADLAGNSIPNRTHNYSSSDTIKVSIKSWKDLANIP